MRWNIDKEMMHRLQNFWIGRHYDADNLNVKTMLRFP